MRKQESDQKAVVLGAAIVIALFIGGFFLVAALNKGDSKPEQTTETSNTSEQTPTSGETDTPVTSPATLDAEAPATPPAATPVSTPVVPGETQPPEEKEISFPPTVAQIKAFFPEGITTVRYWYENMDGREGFEVAVAYAQEKKVHLAILTGTEPLYHILWDAQLPGQSVTSLEVGDRNGDGSTEIAAVTAQSSASGYMNLVQYSDAGPVVLLLKGGEHDGENTKISFSTTTETLSTSSVYRVDLGDKNGNGKDEIDILSGPAVGDINADFKVYQDMYEWNGEQYTFVSQSLVSAATE